MKAPVLVVADAASARAIRTALAEFDVTVTDSVTRAHALASTGAFLCVFTARGFGVRYVRAETRSKLEDALSRAYRSSGCTVIEAVVPDNGAAPLFEAVWAGTNNAIVKR